MAPEKELPEEMENRELPGEETAQQEADRPDGGEEIPERLEQQVAAANDRYLRLSAEFDNYRKRTLKERMELTKTAGEQILADILPVVDNFERALDSLKKSDDVQAVREGVELIYASFRDFLARNGVKEIRCGQEEFDTDFHEAVTKIPAPSKELKGKVVDCIQKGYLLNDKVMRFAKVVVGE